MPAPPSTVAEGDNYRIVQAAGLVICTVWKRPDLTREQGALLAAEKRAHLERLVAGSRLVSGGLVLDLREAPAQWGPQTNATIRAMLAAWLDQDRRVAVICGADSIQRLLVRDLIRELRSARITMVESMESAQAWISP